MAYEEKTILDSSPAKLAELLEATDNQSHVWNTDDLQALFRHQMATPVPVDLDKLSRKKREELKLLANSHDLLLNSYEDLFTHSKPPIELLLLVKQFAKQCLASPNAVLPKEISSVLYYAAIATTLLRHQQQISTLDKDQLQEGLEWCLKKEWLTEPIRDIFTQAKQVIKGENQNG